MRGVLILVSIFYLYVLSQYNIQSFNHWTSENWFIHPYDGGCCVFGQLMAFLTILLLLILLSLGITRGWIYVALSLGWLILPVSMNNAWLSFYSIPLAILWLF